MKLSAKTRYAVRLIFTLAGAGEPVPIAILSEKTGLSPRTVEQVHGVLKSHGITDAQVGARGGLVLLRPVKDIRLGSLVECFDKGVELSVCCGEKSQDCPRRHKCGARAAWAALSLDVQRLLDEVALADLADNGQEWGISK
ncbi:Rrf2 family transcriptional regulator [Desulfovibrio sp. OttesenSCG-928-G11]|nr:Rrf2 family transcriptional regulator [Desulfovibrio sp. OttesenSCG-928-G11]